MNMCSTPGHRWLWAVAGETRAYAAMEREQGGASGEHMVS